MRRCAPRLIYGLSWRRASENTSKWTSKSSFIQQSSSFSLFSASPIDGGNVWRCRHRRHDFRAKAPGFHEITDRFESRAPDLPAHVVRRFAASSTTITNTMSHRRRRLHRCQPASVEGLIHATAANVQKCGRVSQYRKISFFDTMTVNCRCLSDQLSTSRVTSRASRRLSAAIQLNRKRHRQ